VTTLWLPPTESAVVGDVSGTPVVLNYGDPAEEYNALRRGTLLVDRSHRLRATFEGDKAAETLTGLITNDVLALQAGHGQYAAALTPKGKIVADVRVFSRDGDLLVDVPPRAAAGWTAMVRRFVNPRLAKYADRTESLRDVAVFGAGARRLVSALTGIASGSLEALPAYAHQRVLIDGEPAMLARVPELNVEGYELFVGAEPAPALWQRLIAAGATPGGLDAWEIARIEAGRPEWGLDIDETTIPQEANFDELHAISYTKGCYTGQETVARVHFRGHVNRHLRGLRFDDASIVVPPRARLVTEATTVVGDVRSGALSPQLGPIALAMVRREVPLGTAVIAEWEGGTAPAQVVGLPFSA
jgi:folate-binding protein YgfZ